ncbi:MAG: hypothetical protein MUF28_12140 [Ignavibacterium sp.]|jgi:hypothetical protein|nr:hypothetical protein [Ignavibacterium sp.]
MSDNILIKAKTTAQSIKEKAVNFNEIFGDSEKNEIINQFKEKGIDKVEEVFVSIDKFKSLFYEAGYEVGGVNVSLGIPPDISISFKFLGLVDEIKRKEISARLSEHKLASILLQSLFSASDYTEKIKVGDLKLNTINIKLGLIPSISVSLS